jgi:hypothetical protein
MLSDGNIRTGDGRNMQDKSNRFLYTTLDVVAIMNEHQHLQRLLFHLHFDTC